MVGAQQRAPEPRDQRASQRELRELVGEILQRARQRVVAREREIDELHGDARRHDARQRDRRRERAAPHARLRQLRQAEPRERALGEPPAERPHGERGGEQQRGAEPAARLPCRGKHLPDLRAERAEFLPIIVRRTKERGPEPRAENAARAQHELVAQQAAAQLRVLLCQVREAFLLVGGLLERGVELRLARVQVRALPRDGGRFGRRARRGRRPEHVELRLKLRARGHERRRQLVDVGAQRLRRFVERVQLLVGGRGRRLLLDPVERGLHALQFGERLVTRDRRRGRHARAGREVGRRRGQRRAEQMQ